MKSLSRLSSLWNSSTPLSSGRLNTTSLQEWYARLATYDNSNSSPLRMSMMGKPLIELVYALKYNKVENSTRAELWRPSTGVWCEALLLSLAEDAKLDIARSQEEVAIDFPGYFKLTGHIDGVADNETVFDIKCVSASYFKKLVNQLDNERGYITQLALYQVATKLPKAAFLVVNSGTGYAQVVPVPPYLLKQAIKEVQEKLRVLFTEDLDTLVHKLKLGSKIPASLKFSKYLQEMQHASDR